MFVIYNPNDQNQTQAINTDPTKSTAWGDFKEVEVTSKPLVSLLRRYGRDSRLTILDGVVKAVTPHDHPNKPDAVEIRQEKIDQATAWTEEQGQVIILKTIAAASKLTNLTFDQVKALAAVAVIDAIDE